MIVAFIGKMGSGKTLSMTREVHRYAQKGHKIYANYELNFPHEELDFDRLYEMAESQEPMNNMVLAIDEMQIMLDSRSSSTAVNKVMTFWLNQTRKMGVKLFYTTQYEHQVDKRLRSGTDLWVFCDGVHVKKNDKDYFMCYLGITDGQSQKRQVYVGNEYFHLYNTYEVVKFLNRVKMQEQRKAKIEQLRKQRKAERKADEKGNSA